MLTLLVLLRVLEVELSRSTLAEWSCRPLALLPYIKKRQLRYSPKDSSAGSSLASLNKLRKMNSFTNTAELIHVLRPSRFCYCF